MLPFPACYIGLNGINGANIQTLVWSREPARGMGNFADSLTRHKTEPPVDLTTLCDIKGRKQGDGGYAVW